MLPFANYDISSPNMRDQNNKRRRKKRSPAPAPETVAGGGGYDDLAVVKAAAWAWYQRKEGKPIMREFDLSKLTSRITPRPSRYKLEATKNMILSENRVLAENRVSKSSLWYDDHDHNQTLFSRLLDDLLPETYPVSPTSSIFLHEHDHDHDHDHGYGNDDHGFVERKKTPYDHNRSDIGNFRGFVKEVNKRKLWARLILKGPTTVCGRNDDVDLRSSRKSGKVAAAAVALIRSATRGK
ncbi:PREDICTED: uncharacterized protein LOC104805631 [Tarenaya hassleriana]|uniref:uncharacterized protein LOC104805631 n=1 Tax=Tarenaya hassleriana TaxID=28532 RepID=UPI00053C6BAF|nr:PREDICTED: uncharacterized protein LOC104805631 [Tarenaya hassleriana]